MAEPSPAPQSRAEQGSFRDRDSRIFYRGETVYRTLSKRGNEQFSAVERAPFFQRRIADCSIVGTRRAGISIPPEYEDGQWAAVLEHDRIPYISYPYEWCTGMLRDAALLHLDIILEALADDIQLKDASAYNIQFRGSVPVFIDVGSFEPYIAGYPWLGYRQFCEMFLYPLFLASYRGLAPQPLLRGSIEGVSIDQIYALLSFRDLFRSGVLTHAFLQKKFQDRFAARASDVRGEMQRSGFRKQFIEVNVHSLRRLIDRIKIPAPQSHWVRYAAVNSYGAEDAQAKENFIREICRERPRSLVWDIGSNTGTFSKIAAAHSACVVAFDSDHASVEALYRELKSSGDTRILPLVGNIANPSPNQGWRGAERRTLDARGAPDLVLALALVHHIVISANIPLVEFIGYLRQLGSELAIEFVSKEDPMVKRLLANKDDRYTDYDAVNFERVLSLHYSIERKLPLRCGTRILYYCRPR